MSLRDPAFPGAGVGVSRPVGAAAEELMRYPRWRFDAIETPCAEAWRGGFTCARVTPHVMGRADRHNEVELNLVTDGALTYLLGGRRVRIEPGRLVAFWAAVPHQVIEFEGTQPYFVVTIPLDWFLRRRLPGRIVRPLMEGQVVGGDSAERAWLDEALLETWVRDVGSGDDHLILAMHREVEARLLRLSELCAEATVETAVSRSPDDRADELGQAERMARHIALAYAEPLSVLKVAQAVQLSPRVAMRIFHRGFGQSLGSYVNQHRIFHAQRLLTTTTQRVGEVSRAAGFGSLSRFNLAFRRSCGCSPRDYRRIHRVGGKVP